MVAIPFPTSSAPGSRQEGAGRLIAEILRGNEEARQDEPAGL
jgi:hypothetical protein